MAIKEKKYSIDDFYKRIEKLRAANRANITEFLENSTIHGLRYFNKNDLNITERIYFIITFMVVLIVSGYFISNVTEKWSYSPTITSLNSEPDYINDDPFPTITICNMNQALKGHVANLSLYSQDYAILQMICNRKANTTVMDSIKDWGAFKDFIEKVSQPCERMLLECVFGGVKYNCSHIFRPVLLSEGVCCIFNSLDASFTFTDGSPGLGGHIQYPPNFKAVPWTLEDGYQHPLPKHFSPMTAVGKGQLLGLKVTLNVEADEYRCSSSNSIGFKMAIHNPNERPDIYETGILIAPGVESFIRIIPNKMEADDKLRGIPRKDRNCIFNNEYKMKTFQHYSYINCMRECRTAMAIHYCGCIAAYMAPRSPNSTVCRYDQLKCLESIKLASKMNEFGCNEECWQCCVSREFALDIFSATLEKRAMEYISRLFDNQSIAYVKKNVAIAKFYIEHLSYLSTKQAPYIDSLNVLSSVGGLIGVFFGFSFISFAEIIYYICIRHRRTTSLNITNKNTNDGGKPRILLANRSKVRFVNPYKNPIYTLNAHTLVSKKGRMS